MSVCFFGIPNFGGGDGPWVNPDLTLRLETGPGSPTLDASNWANQGSAGTGYNYVTVPGIANPTIETEDGINFLRFGAGGPGRLNQATVPGSDIWAPPVAGKHAPFYSAHVVRVNSTPNARGLVNLAGGPSYVQGAQLDYPIAASFQLTWQWEGNPTANIQTIPDLTSTILGKWVLYEWNWDGTNFKFYVNGTDVSLNNQDPTGSTPAIVFTNSSLGNSTGIDIDVAAILVNKAALSPEHLEQNRIYLQTTYAALLDNV